ncbi:hypothetical protein Poli38472_011467 [Pythium oligandrum]|uniref:Lytic polysaccharide monooxygenase n=1 Tax=Pythium oligandrum TaxID=41045 RepID=A0A8K1CLN3_PYTOL|nr:hypothetical protein Poli38472_011467 [Pythium oligandrum]|eukprot:TMW64587.1 hypothetical protein Poli38472_011467 [Pythium oligandrum]
MKFLVALALAALTALPSSDAHSWLTKPMARNPGPLVYSFGGSGCPDTYPKQSVSYKSGETIDIRYWRNNHLGGFIRWSLVPRGKEDSKLFDDSVFAYTCRESGPECLPKGQNTRYAGDSSGDNTIACGDKITLPDYLPAGDYVLQWIWFGVGSSYGNLGWAEPQFRSCSDIKLTTSGSKTKPACPSFTGGDRVTKLENKGNDQCFYFHTTDIVQTPFKGDNAKAAENYKFGIPAAVEKCKGSTTGGDSDVTPAPSNVTTPAPTTKAPVATPVPSSAAPQPSSAAPTPSATSKCGAKYV